jgi:hypothetical protein
MEHKVDCALVRDLLPNYVEKLTCDKTNEILEEHFINCTECTKERDEMLFEMNVDKMPENQDMAKYLNKTKRRYLLRGILFSLGIISIIVCFIVDIAINYKLTWSLIVDMGIIYTYVCGYTPILCKKNKIAKTLLMISILILPMLYGIEYVVNVNYLKEPIYWFNAYALPITLIWLAILWVTLLVHYITKTNIWNIIGVLLLLTIFGATFTDAISQKVSFAEAITSEFNWIDISVYFICAIISFIVGYLRKGKRRI